MIDTHTHLYLDVFDNDRTDMIDRARKAGVTHILLPDIEPATTQSMLKMCASFPDMCYPMMGIHPCSIKENYKVELAKVEKWLFNSEISFCGVGEIGLDYYWDKTLIHQQKEALRAQLNWAKQLKKPVSLHTREAIDDAIIMVKEEQNGNLTGVFHCYSGDSTQANQITNSGLYLGIGGVVTYKKNTLPGLLKDIGLKYVVLETDAPYLPPVPYRGGRNESAYLSIIAQSIADILDMDVEDVKHITTENAKKVFGFN